jgi:hypothetical protein
MKKELELGVNKWRGDWAHWAAKETCRPVEEGKAGEACSVPRRLRVICVVLCGRLSHVFGPARTVQFAGVSENNVLCQRHFIQYDASTSVADKWYLSGTARATASIRKSRIQYASLAPQRQ